MQLRTMMFCSAAATRCPMSAGPDSRPKGAVANPEANGITFPARIIIR